MKERLQKYMARCGVASRRKSEELIAEKRVSINGSIVSEVVMIDEEVDVVRVDGEIIKPEERKVYIILNKPFGIITSVKDQFDRKTVTDIIDIKERIYPVGRLDYDTTGLIILTNDGDIAFKLTHPSHEIQKVYRAKIVGVPNHEEIEKFKNGIKIDDYITSYSDIRLLNRDGENCIVDITIHEGKNRQVRRMCDAINHPVIELQRIRMGDISLNNLEVGEWRELSLEEVEYLKSL